MKTPRTGNTPKFPLALPGQRQVEVDFLLKSTLRKMIGIEVKVAASGQLSDFKGLRKLREIAGAQFVTGHRAL